MSKPLGLSIDDDDYQGGGYCPLDYAGELRGYDSLIPPSSGAYIEANRQDNVPLFLWKRHGPPITSAKGGGASGGKQATPIMQSLQKVERELALGTAVAGGRQPPRTFNHDQLWVNKYSPKHFTDLLSNDMLNAQLLQWLGSWRPSSCKLANEKFPIVILHGPPGLGKTTLAHIAATTAGFHPLEINASDDRSGEAVVARVQSIISSSSLFDQKPTCLVIDEIDGAASVGEGTSLVSFLAQLTSVTAHTNVSTRLATTENSSDEETHDRNEEGTLARKKKAKVTTARRPIICICNDLYAPVLRPLRSVVPSDHVIRLTRPSPAQLTSRLKTVCEEEGLRADTRAILHLAEQLDCDVRSCLNALQFISQRTESISSSVMGKELQAWKDSTHSNVSILELVFGASAASDRHRLDRLLHNADDRERLIAACFEVYPTARFFDTQKLGRVIEALDWVSWSDSVITRKLFDHPHLGCYETVTLKRLNTLFASPNQPRFQYPKLDYELSQAKANSWSLVKSFAGHLPAAERQKWRLEEVQAILIPVLLSLSRPKMNLFKSANRTLLNDEERSEVRRIACLLISYGLDLRQDRNIEGHYYYTLDPYPFLFPAC